MASLRELDEYYSYEDALNMAEVVTVQRYNERISMEDASKRG